VPVPLIVGSLAAKFAKAKITNALSRETKSQLTNISLEIFGYDFVSLFIKIIIFYTVALIIEKYHNIVNGVAGFWADLLGFFGVKIPKHEPDIIKKFFSEEGVEGIRWWNLIHGLVITLIVIEAMIYIKTNTKQGATPSPFTLATFGLIIAAIASMTLSDLFAKLKNTFDAKTQQVNK